MKFLDLFAGIGGFRLGMERAGHECVGYVEWDKYARKSYEAIHDTEGEFTAHDITMVTDDDLRLLRGKGIDVICGGPPCQSFSVAGKQGGFDDTRGTMFFEVARIAKQIKPRILFLENVKGLLSNDKGNTFRIILNTLDELGYDAEWQLLNSDNFGVPQNRERVFIIGHLRGERRSEVFPIRGEINEDSTFDQPSPKIRIKEVGKLYPDRHSSLANSILSTEGLSPTLDAMQGGSRQPKILDFSQSAREGKPRIYDDISPTIAARDYKDPRCVIGSETQGKIRRLTPKECWRLQSFPDSAFEKAAAVNSDSQLYKQAGNSVTVNVIYEIAKRL